MSVDWKTYEQFDWLDSNQVPMNVVERSLVEKVVCNALGVGESFTGHLGVASPPGRYAATVVHISKNLSHRFQDAISNLRVNEIGVKVYKPSSDANREFTKVLPFHNGSERNLPGIPHPQVQRTLWAGRISCSNQTSRGVAVQEWAVGETLDLFLADQISLIASSGCRLVTLIGSRQTPSRGPKCFRETPDPEFSSRANT